MASSAGPSRPVSILSGVRVGLLDPTQSTRLLDTPNSTLFFASFDPHTASHNTRIPSTKDESGRRVVIETLATGESIWRWVPRAKGVENTTEEGVWPRTIDICGQHFFCSQEQWDIYKLDPAYECTILPFPELSTITRCKIEDTPDPGASRPTTASLPKRAKEDSSDDEVTATRAKKPRTSYGYVETEEDSDSDEEVEGMLDEGIGKDRWRRRQSKSRARSHPSRKERDESPTKATPKKLDEIEDLSMLDLTNVPAPPSPSGPGWQGWASFPEGVPTRATSPAAGYTGSETTAASSYVSSDRTYVNSSSSSVGLKGPHPHPPQMPTGTNGSISSTAKRAANSPDRDGLRAKRARPTSPCAPSARSKNTPAPVSRKASRAPGKNKKEAKLRTEKEKRERRDRAFLESLRASVPADGFSDLGRNGTGHVPKPADQTYVPDEDPISLEEKIRRVREMNAIESARARAAKEESLRKFEEEQAEKMRKQEAERQKERERQEWERREREKEKEMRRRKKQEEEERLKRQRAMEEEKVRREQEEQQQREQQRREQRWNSGPWTTQRALERYKTVLAAFSKTKFSAENPITFMTTPWPVLFRPKTFSMEDVDHQAVTAFFAAVKPHMRSQDFKILLKDSRNRLHPDNWRGRRIYRSVQDEQLRACFEVTVGLVSATLNALYDDIGG
ncbi:hypothetical protein EW026_g2040 [Hermanssonia centrifuga]|uniref:Uncharacterized protein n=1 Tax=Hermanssonia centrifuga TaxID=98765 RepID=A0A4S4KPI8_9APHY|nr:hypothetical protein EW026_g2040 [Hermanssonia centrifuga]